MKSVILICAVLLGTFAQENTITGNDIPQLPLYIGRGYDVLHGNPLSDEGVDPGFNHEIIEFTYDKQEKT